MKKYALALAFCLVPVMAVNSQTAPTESPRAALISKMNAKMTKAWASGNWTPESVALMKRVWAGFQNATSTSQKHGVVSSFPMLGTPNPGSVDDYIGSYTVKGPRGRVWPIVVSREKDGLLVTVRGEPLPGVIWNDSLLFSTGDVIISPVPSFGGDKNGAIEMYILTCINKKFYFITLVGLPSGIEATKAP